MSQLSLPSSRCSGWQRPGVPDDCEHHSRRHVFADLPKGDRHRFRVRQDVKMSRAVMRNPVDATLMGPPRRFTSDRFRHGFVVCVSVCTVGAAGASHARGPLVVWSLVCRSVGALVIVLVPVLGALAGGALGNAVCDQCVHAPARWHRRSSPAAWTEPAGTSSSAHVPVKRALFFTLGLFLNSPGSRTVVSP